jgi:hypothetical protein
VSEVQDAFWLGWVGGWKLPQLLQGERTLTGRNLRRLWCNLSEIQILVKIENFPELLFRKILETGSTLSYKIKHELYHKFYEDHERVVRLYFR